ncbi:hypothetical protein I5677_09355 [Mobilitalea sibirica]|uniref:Uncharacterized protein n=1 Tax=Mobilitalea sibirica TaxID=1462919 RepID=A0A8J7HBH3_9FIRM|nr:hypothetical protein [Mobilitalea sibirica]MBH1941096.1 hypothetical protein [Mobilitalea sibirica]
MIETYIEWIFIILIAYITIFNILTGHLQGKWSIAFKRKLKRIYFPLWIIPYFTYIYCVWATSSTRPFLKQHILFAAIFHSIMAVFGYRATFH